MPAEPPPRCPSPCFPGAWPEHTTATRPENPFSADYLSSSQLDHVLDFQKRLSASLAHSETIDFLRSSDHTHGKDASMQALETVDTLCEALGKNDLSSASTATYLHVAHTSLSADRIMLFRGASDQSSATPDYVHRLYRSTSSPVLLFSPNDTSTLPRSTLDCDGTTSDFNDASFASTEPLQMLTSSGQINPQSHMVDTKFAITNLASLLLPRNTGSISPHSSSNNIQNIHRNDFSVDEDYFSYIPPRGPLASYRSFEQELHSHPSSPLSRFSRRSSLDSHALSRGGSSAVYPISAIKQRPHFPVAKYSNEAAPNAIHTQDGPQNDELDTRTVVITRALSNSSSPDVVTATRPVQAHTPVPKLPQIEDKRLVIRKPVVVAQNNFDSRLSATPNLQLAQLIAPDDFNRNSPTHHTFVQPSLGPQQHFTGSRPPSPHSRRSLAAGHPEDVMTLQDALATAPPLVIRRSVASQVRTAPLHRNTHNLTPLLRLTDTPRQRSGNLIDQIKNVSQKLKRRLLAGKSAKQAISPSASAFVQRTSTSPVANNFEDISQPSDSFVIFSHPSPRDVASMDAGPPSPPGLTTPSTVFVDNHVTRPTEASNRARCSHQYTSSGRFTQTTSTLPSYSLNQTSDSASTSMLSNCRSLDLSISSAEVDQAASNKKEMKTRRNSVSLRSKLSAAGVLGN